MIRKVTLVGIGAIGAWLAEPLAKYLGKDFRILLSGERKTRIENNGITINGTRHDFTIVTPEMKDDPADLILIAVKRHHLEQAISDMRQQVGPDTLILSTLNGLDSESVVIGAFGEKHVLYSLIRVSVEMKNDRIDFNPKSGMLYFGEEKNQILSDRVRKIRDLFDAAKLNYRIEPDMIYEIWRKFLVNIGENMTCALLGIPYGVLASSSDAAAISQMAMQEVVEIARKVGIDLRDELARLMTRTFSEAALSKMPSTLQDLNNKRKTEVEMFSGEVVRLGKIYGVSTPVNSVMLHGIRVLEERANY